MPAVEATKTHLIQDWNSDSNWADVLSGIDVVVHAAARAHILKETAADSIAAFRRANVEATLRLATQAAHAGVRRFVFISTIKVNGEETTKGRPILSQSPYAPSDPYAISKMEAEVALRSLSVDRGMELVVVRPCVVYGPGVKANFKMMIQCVKRGIPLPFGNVANLRSLVALDNLTDLISRCIVHPAAANETFLVSDGEDVSTSDLLRRIGDALGVRTRLFSVPHGILKFGAGITGRAEAARRLLGSFQVDIQKTREILDWSPPINLNEGLRRAVTEFHTQRFG